MSRIPSIAPAERRRLAPLFEEQPYLEVAIDAVLEGRAGEARVVAADPSAARLDLGLFAFLGGNPGGDEAAELTKRCILEVSDDLLFQPCFESAEALARDGLGFCALHRGVPAAAAVSGMRSSTGIEIQVNTAESHRRRGHARAASAALMLAALERGLTPHWDSASPGSQRLARQLGYRDKGHYPWWIADFGSVAASR